MVSEWIRIYGQSFRLSLVHSLRLPIYLLARGCMYNIEPSPHTTSSTSNDDARYIAIWRVAVVVVVVRAPS